MNFENFYLFQISIFKACLAPATPRWVFETKMGRRPALSYFSPFSFELSTLSFWSPGSDEEIPKGIASILQFREFGTA